MDNFVDVEHPMTLAANRTPVFSRNTVLPGWLPKGVQAYLVHTGDGLSLRELARQRGCHASTVLRQVRRTENRRDDPLVDEALLRLTGQTQGHPPGNGAGDASPIWRMPCLLPDQRRPL